MNAHSRSGLLRALCLLFLSLLFAFAQDVRAGGAEETEESLRVKEFASLHLQIDKHGAARVTFHLAFKPGDASALKKSLADTLGFPLQFRDERGGFDEEEQVQWWLLDAYNEHAFAPHKLVSGGRIDTAPLLNTLRSLGVKELSVLIFFDDKVSNLRVNGATQFRAPEFDGMHMRYNVPMPYVYTAQVRTDGPPVPRIEFSWGYRSADLLRQSVPLFAFALVPLLLTMWMSRSVLKMKEAGSEAVWGRYFRYLNWLINGLWLLWLPVYSLADISEIFSAGGTGGPLLNFAGLMLYFLPPLAVLYLCHMLSRRVYTEVRRGAEWSPREVMGRAILANAAVLMPLFFLILGLNMFAARSLYAGLLVFIAVLCWVLFTRYAGRAFNLSAQAVLSGELRDRLFALAEKAGVRLQQIYVLPDGEGQLTNAFARSDNAVMLTGSLLRRLSKREVDAIMAHEIGHLKEKHPQTLSRINIAVIIVANIVVAAVSSAVNLQRWTPALFSVSIACAMLITHFLSRGNERHADSIAVNLTADPEAFITGLAKISRLNLMPLHTGGWSESLETHPATMRRLLDVAGCGGISPARLQEMLHGPVGVEEHYSLPAPESTEEKLFSTAFKSKYGFRIYWAMIGTVIAAPVLLILLAALLRPEGLVRWLTLVFGIGVTFALYQMVRNSACFWGYDSLERRLREKLRSKGFEDAAREGLFTGFAPACEPSIYENSALWDAGLLRLTDERLCYVGEETQFALSREQIVDVYLGDSQPLWLRQQHLYIRWRDRERGTSGTFYLIVAQARTLLQSRRKLRALDQQLRAWLGRKESCPAAAAEPLSSLAAPDYPLVTSKPMRECYTLRSFLVSTLQLTFFAFLISVGVRLPAWGIGVALGIVIGVCVLDQLPKLFERAAKKRTPHDATAPSPLEPPTPARGAWAESET
jgi:Zn-dependent protease with chaperone function